MTDDVYAIYVPVSFPLRHYSMQKRSDNKTIQLDLLILEVHMLKYKHHMLLGRQMHIPVRSLTTIPKVQ